MDSINLINGSRQKTKFAKNIQIFHTTKGIQKSGMENYEDSIKEITETIRFNPRDFKLYFDRAILMVRTGDFEGARRDFKLSENCHRNSDIEIEDYPVL